MKKVILSTGLALALIASAGAVSTTATPSTHKVYVDGEKANVAAYEINGNNFFKLRDIAAILNGTDAQFEVTWNGAENRIDLTDDKAYTTVGGELETIPAGTQTANLSTAGVYQDGSPATLTGFEINGNNYYKLRDVADAFDFNVTWDGENQRVDIITTESYVPEDEGSTVTGETSQRPITPANKYSFTDHELWQIVSMMEYDEVNPEYQRWVDSFEGTAVTVTVDIRFNDFFGDGEFYPANADVMLTENRTIYPDGFKTSWPKKIPVKRVQTDENGRASITVDIPQEVYEEIEKGNSWYQLSVTDGTTIRWSENSDPDYFLNHNGTLYYGGGVINFKAIQDGYVTMNLTPGTQV